MFVWVCVFLCVCCIWVLFVGEGERNQPLKKEFNYEFINEYY